MWPIMQCQHTNYAPKAAWLIKTRGWLIIVNHFWGLFNPKKLDISNNFNTVHEMNKKTRTNLKVQHWSSRVDLWDFVHFVERSLTVKMLSLVTRLTSEDSMWFQVAFPGSTLNHERPVQWSGIILLNNTAKPLPSTIYSIGEWNVMTTYVSPAFLLHPLLSVTWQKRNGTDVQRPIGVSRNDSMSSWRLVGHVSLNAGEICFPVFSAPCSRISSLSLLSFCGLMRIKQKRISASSIICRCLASSFWIFSAKSWFCLLKISHKKLKLYILCASKAYTVHKSVDELGHISPSSPGRGQRAWKLLHSCWRRVNNVLTLRIILPCSPAGILFLYRMIRILIQDSSWAHSTSNRKQQLHSISGCKYQLAPEGCQKNFCWPWQSQRKDEESVLPWQISSCCWLSLIRMKHSYSACSLRF